MTITVTITISTVLTWWTVSSSCSSWLAAPPFTAAHVEARALEIAREIAPHPMFGVQTAKRVMRSSAECGYLDALDIERDAQSVLLCAHDFPEAMKAFSEKRKPEFKDR